LTRGHLIEFFILKNNFSKNKKEKKLGVVSATTNGGLVVI
jgi:hypothetical protein